MLLHYKCTLFSNFTRTLSFAIEIMQIPSKIYIFYYIKYKPCKPSMLVARINYARIAAACRSRTSTVTLSPTHRPACQPTKQPSSKLQSSVRKFQLSLHRCASSYLLHFIFHFFAMFCAILPVYFLTQLTFFCRRTNFYEVNFAA